MLSYICFLFSELVVASQALSMMKAFGKDCRAIE